MTHERGRRALLSRAMGVSVALLAVIPLTGTATAAPDAPPPTTRADPGELSISAQDFALVPDDVFDVIVALPPGYDTATLGAEGADSHITVELREEAETIDAVRAVLGDDLPRVVDSVLVPLDIAAADPRIVRPSATELGVSVQTETVASEAEALELAHWGVYPVTVALVVDGDRVADVTTFVTSLPAPDAEDVPDDLAVGLVVGTTESPVILPDGHVRPSAAELEELTLLADALDAIDASAAALDEDAPPRAVSVEPATLAALPDVDPELSARLVDALDNGVVIARPRLPFDPSSALSADREDLFTRLLREGEDVLAAALPSTRIDRSLLLATNPISAAAVSLRRDLGTQLVILPYDRYERLDGSIKTFTDTSQLFALDAGERAQVPAIVIDPVLSELLESNGDRPPLAVAVDIVAQLIALSRQIDANGGVVGRHGIVLARSDGGIPDPELLGLVTRLLLESDGVELVRPSDLASIVDTQIIDGRALRVIPPESAGVDLTDRFAEIDALSRDVLGTASMLPENEPLVATWTTVLGAVVSTSLDDADATAMIDSLRADIDVYRNGVLGPAPYTFRFTGRSGTIPFKIRNLTDRPLTVRITMTSAKLEFRDADRLVELPPLQETEVSMPFEALSNGTSSVFLRIFTPAPEPSPETQIVSDIILTARVTTLTGLGQLVTGAALLVLCTWWIRHWRQTRRRRLADAVTPRHPAANGRAGDVRATADEAVDSDPGRDETTPAGVSTSDGPTTDVAAEDVIDAERAPDAAASTIPPS